MSFIFVLKLHALENMGHGSQPNISAVYVCSLQTTGMHVVLHHSIFAILVLRQDLQREICMLVGF
jgi:hypothetical protein